MPILNYFLSVGTALTLALFVLSAYVGPSTPDRSAKISKPLTTATIVKVEPERAGAK